MAKRPEASCRDQRDALQRRIVELEAENARLSGAEAELRACLQRVEDFAAATGGWLWETDARLRFTYVSRSVEAATGVAPEWYYGKTREDIGVPTSVSPEAWSDHLQCLAERRPFRDFTFQRAGPNGVRWMRTGGRPVLDPSGTFQGYRGAALDVTPTIEAERRLARLAAAVEGLTEMFVLWDENDRLLVCNQRYRQINARVAPATQPGTTFREHVEAALAAGLYPSAQGREQAWLAERLELHRHPRGPFELEQQNGRWLLVHDQRLPDGAAATIATDITVRKQGELALQGKAGILEASFRAIPDGILVVDRDLRPVAWNDRLFEVLAIEDDVERAVSRVRQDLRCALVQDDPAPEGDAGPIAEPTLSMAIVPSQDERQLAGGRWVEARITPMAGGGCVAVYRDISDLKRLQKELERQATTDILTGVLNRRQFFEIARQELCRAGRHGHPLSLLVLTIDHLDSITDTHGDATSDAALRLVAQASQRHLRRGDAFGRIGSEAFAAVLPMTGGGDAAGVAEKLCTLIAASKLPLPKGSLHLTASIGVAEWPGQAETIEQLIDRADAALRQARQHGPGAVQLDRCRPTGSPRGVEEALACSP